MNTDTNRWVDDRLAALGDGSEWQPNAGPARARLRGMDRQARIKRRWAWVGAAAACLGLMAFVQPRACANPRGCVQSAAQKAASAPIDTAPPNTVTAVPAPAAAVTPAPTSAVKPQAAAPAQQNPADRNYKETGSAGAPITCEIYSDYECPSCAAFFRDIMPQLMAEYVNTGKVKLLHRDFPLPQHPYAKLAARYANAAGEAGQYGLAVNTLFATRTIWSANGEVEAQLAPVLPPAVMRKVRELVQHDAQLDDTVAADRAMGASDRIRATPTVVVVWKGNRQAISPIPSFTWLKNYLDELLAR